MHVMRIIAQEASLPILKILANAYANLQTTVHLLRAQNLKIKILK